MDEWLRTWRSIGTAGVAAAVAFGTSWVVSAHTYVVMANGKLYHPSPLGLPLYVAIGLLAVGAYLYAATLCGRLPLPGRRRAETRAQNRATNAMYRQMRKDMDAQGPLRVELPDVFRVRLTEHITPSIAAPAAYEVAQLRQVLSRLSAHGVHTVDTPLLDLAMTKGGRDDVEPMFEPLRPSLGVGLRTLVETGVLVPVNDRTDLWRISIENGPPAAE